MGAANRSHFAILAGAAIGLEAAAVAWLRLGDLQFQLPIALAWFTAAATVYLIAAWLVLQPGFACNPARLRWMLAAAVVFRLTLVPLQPTLSDRLLRFHWEGEIQHAGFNPYEHAPASALFDPIRKPIDRAVTRDTFASVYPPLAERLMRWSYGLLGPRIRPLKLFWIGVEFLTILLLLRMLRARGLPRSRILLYVWAPLPLLEIAGQGQMEIAAIFFALLAFHWAARLPRLTALAFASAMLTSVLAWPLLPWWWRAAGPAAHRRGPLGLAAAWMALCSLPFFWMHQTLAWQAPLANLRGFFQHLGAATLWAMIPLLGLWIAPWLVFRPRPAALFFTLSAVWASTAPLDRAAGWFIAIPLALLLVWDRFSARRPPSPAVNAATA